MAIRARGATCSHVLTTEGPIERVDPAYLFIQSGLRFRLVMSLAVVEQRRPVSQRLVEDRFPPGIVADSGAPPLMGYAVRYRPFQTVFNGGPLLAHDIGHVAHRGRVEINIEGAGDRAEAGKFRAAQSGD